LVGDQIPFFPTEHPGQLPAPEASQAGETIVTQGEARGTRHGDPKKKTMGLSQRMKVQTAHIVISCDIVANYILNLLTKSDIAAVERR